MKVIKIIILLFLFVCMPTNAQVAKVGNTFSMSSKQKQTTQKDTIVTPYNFEDKKGNKYPIILEKDSGVCYVWRKSAKSRRAYKQRFNSKKNIDISLQICKAYNLPFKGNITK